MTFNKKVFREVVKKAAMSKETDFGIKVADAMAKNESVNTLIALVETDVVTRGDVFVALITAFVIMFEVGANYAEAIHVKEE